MNRKIINAVSITQDNESKCHDNKHNAQNARRGSNKKRRQFLKRDLRQVLKDEG